jgi:plasmid stability protein
MAGRVQIVIDTDEAVEQALRLRAAREGGSTAEAAAAILRRALAAEIQEVSGAPPLAAVIQEVMKAGGKLPPS